MRIVRRQHRVLVQGITGKQGSFWTERMQAYGTTIVGGVNPKKAGTVHLRGPGPWIGRGRHGSGRRVRRLGALHPAAWRQGGGAGRHRGRGPKPVHPDRTHPGPGRHARGGGGGGCRLRGHRPQHGGLGHRRRMLLRIHARLQRTHLQEGHARRHLAVRQPGHADVPERGHRRLRPQRLHRHRRRSHHRHHDPGRPGGPRRLRGHRGRDHRRRNRRYHGGRGRRIRGHHDQAGVRLHRRRCGASGQEDGPRGRHRDRRQGHLQIQAQGIGKRRVLPCSTRRPT